MNATAVVVRSENVLRFGNSKKKRSGGGKGKNQEESDCKTTAGRRTFLSQIWSGLLPIEYMIERNPDWKVFLNILSVVVKISVTKLD